jgi:hypothetical protein
MESERQLVRRGLRLLGRDSVLVAALYTMGVNRNKPQRESYEGCFVTFAVFGGLLPSEPEAGELEQFDSYLTSSPVPELAAISAAHVSESYFPGGAHYAMLQEEVEAYLGFTIEEAQRVIIPQDVLEYAVSQIPTDVDIAEWLLEQGIELACDKSIAGGPTNNCPMANYFRQVWGLDTAVGRWTVRLLRNGLYYGEAVDLPKNVQGFTAEFDSQDVY